MVCVKESELFARYPNVSLGMLLGLYKCYKSQSCQAFPFAQPNPNFIYRLAFTMSSPIEIPEQVLFMFVNNTAQRQPITIKLGSTVLKNGLVDIGGTWKARLNKGKNYSFKFNIKFEEEDWCVDGL